MEQLQSVTVAGGVSIRRWIAPQWQEASTCMECRVTCREPCSLRSIPPLLADAARASGGRVVTMELSEKKKLNPGAIIVSDNMLEPESAREAVLRYRAAVRGKAKMTSILVPVGSGLEISRYDA
jgi:hypothetical protein